jgi:putative DNA primase/helicase
VLNGISDVATRGDLADRVLSITLPPVAEDKRRDEGELWAGFYADRPRILGALYNAVQAGLRNRATVRLARKARMAEFALWIEACSPGLGWEPGEFVRDYEENRSDAMAAAAEASPVVLVIEAVLVRSGLPAEGFAGTASELLAKLPELCSESEQKARWFPSTPSHVGRALRRIAPLLRQREIEFKDDRDTNRNRTRGRHGVDCGPS